MAFARIAGRGMADTTLAVPSVAETRIVALEARPVAEVASAIPVLSREARLFPTARLEEARVINPEFMELTRGVRLRPDRLDPAVLMLPGCPAGGEHDHSTSANYTLAFNQIGQAGQSNWRLCRKCMGLAYGASGGVCPRGGAHDLAQSADYVLLANSAAPVAYQSNWRWCSKCQGLAYGGAQGACPAGGLHDHAGSGDYCLPINNPDAEGQPNWRWCAKCMGLGFAGGTVGSTREELGLPVADADPINPDAAFTAAAGGAQSYLPRYTLARQVVSGAEQYEIRVAPGPDGQWALRVALARSRPEGLTATAEIDHDLLVQLRFSVLKSDGGTIIKTLDFTEIGETETGSAVIAQMRLASLGERDQVVTAITTQSSACGLVVTRSVRVAVPVAGGSDRFRPVTRGLAQVVDPDPLYLNPALHRYLHDGAAPQGGAGPGLVARQVQFDGAFHDYWQDAVDPACVYYLPDAFRLARRESPAPFAPMLSVRVMPGATIDADPVVTMELAATPWSNPRRLEAARRELAKRLPMMPGEAAATATMPELGGDLGGALGGFLGDLLRKNKAAPGTPLGDALGEALGLQLDDARVGRVRMEPLPVQKATLWLAVPGAGGGGLAERPAAQVDLRTAVILSETMPLPAFQQIYDALMGGSVSLMKGEVRFDRGDGATGRIPVEVRFDRMNGPVFQTEVTPGTAAGGAPGAFQIRLTNAVESPLRVEALAGSLLIGGHEVAAVTRVSVALPCTLPPGDSLTVTLAPKRALANLPGGPKVEPLLDFGRVSAVPDGEKLWDAILDADTTAEARRRVRVKLFPGMFDGPSGKPEDRAFAVIVQFEGGSALELTPDKPEGEVTLAGGSITDLVLRRGSTGGYRYRCQVIRRTKRLTDPDWRDDRTDLLIPLWPEG